MNENDGATTATRKRGRPTKRKAPMKYASGKMTRNKKEARSKKNKKQKYERGR